MFALGRSIVGAQHAALAVLLMVGVAAFTVPTPDFGPVILTMPLWAIILLHYWRAVGEGRRAYWLLLAIEIGLLLLTTYVGLILVGLLVLFTLVNARARAALNSYDPLIAAAVAGIVMGPHLIWVADSGEGYKSEQECLADSVGDDVLDVGYQGHHARDARVDAGRGNAWSKRSS